jgi:hypothetical protein
VPLLGKIVPAMYMDYHAGLWPNTTVSS